MRLGAGLGKASCSDAVMTNGPLRKRQSVLQEWHRDEAPPKTVVLQGFPYIAEA